jgi:PAS domain-containing protein
LQSLIDDLRAKCRQLSYAIEIGEEDLVSALDRQIDPLIRDVLDGEPRSQNEVYEQLRVICELLRQYADDHGSVIDKATAMMLLLDRLLKRRSTVEALPAAPPSPPYPVMAANDVQLAEAMLDQMPDGVVLVGRDCRLLFANKTFCNFHTIKPLECIGRNIADFIAAEAETRYISRLVETVFTLGLSSSGAVVDGKYYRVKPFELREGQAIAAMILVRVP